MDCLSCGSVNPAGKKFCGECGGPLPASCAACGAENPPRAKFCGDCGAALTAAVPTPAASKPAARPIETAPQAERRQLTVMFCDLVGSTALASRLDPEDLRDVMSAYHRCVAETVGRYDGFVAKYMGDGVLVYFGYPRAHEDDAERAVRAGIELPRVLSSHTAGDGVALAVRVGIATGEVVVGDLIGEGAAQEKAVVGETPNLAARLQTLAGPNEVFIGTGTHRLVAGLFDLTDMGRNELKGFDGKVQAWRVQGESRAESRFAARTESGLTPFVGRQHELGMLLDRFGLAKDGEGQVVLLAGEPGIGKSRLAHALLERVAGEPHTRLRYYCSPYHANSALHPIIEQLDRAAGFEPDDQPERKLEKLESLLSRATNNAAAVMPLIAALLSIPVDGRYAPLSMPAKRQRELTIGALLDQLCGLAAHQPVLLVLEDSQWLDPTSTELFDRVIERLQTLPIFLLITMRPEFAPPWTSYPHMTSLTLNRLGRRHSTDMVAAVAGGKALPEAILAQIWEKTGGVPLFVEELTKTVLESSLLEARGDRYVLTGPLPPLAIPSTLQDSLMARLDRLAPVKEVAQIGAVIGREFHYRLLAALSALDETDLQEALSQLVGSELVFRRGVIPDATYSFKHAFVQDAAYRSLLKSKRQQLHAKVAAALRERFADTIEGQPELLAHHLTEAGLTAEAIGCWQRAGQLAAERSANAEAAAHFYRALDILRVVGESDKRQENELDLLTTLGSLLQVSKGHGHAEVATVYGRARDVCRSVDDTSHLAAVLQGLRLHHMLRTELALARETGAELLALGERTGDSGYLVEGYRAIGVVHMYSGSFHAARDQLERGIALYDAQVHGKHALRYVEDPGMICLSHLGKCLWSLGYPDQALARNDEAVALARSIAHPATMGEAMAMRADIAMLRREVQDAREWAAATLALATEHGLPLPELVHGADGIEQIRQSLSVLAATGVELYRPYCLARLAGALSEIGQMDEAFSAIDEAIEHSRRSGMRYWDSELHRSKGELILSGGGMDPAAAEASFHQAIDIARAQSAKSHELRAATSLARLWAKQGKRRQAHDLLAPIYGWFTEGFDTLDLREAKALLDEVAGA